MMPNSLSTDERTDVLKNLISKPLTSASLPVVTRELASVMISVSAQTNELYQLVKGSNGSGLLEQVRALRTDLQALLDRREEERAQEEDQEEAAKKPGNADYMRQGLKWFADKVLPTLVTTAILAFIAFQIAVSNHIHLVQMAP